MASSPTPDQWALLVAALESSSDTAVRNAMARGNPGPLADWLNSSSNQKAWLCACSKQDLFEAMRITTYDSVVAGKKESWRLMLDLAPVDMNRAQMRKAIVDIFGATDGDGMLSDLREWASIAEVTLGGTNATTGTVTGLKRNWAGKISARELRTALGWD